MKLKLAPTDSIVDTYHNKNPSKERLDDLNEVKIFN